MTGVAIVAVPPEDDYIWKLSSEKVPHMTLLFLGEMEPGPEMARIESFLQHIVDTSLSRFGMYVDHRGELGPMNADVLFFKNKEHSQISIARRSMLTNPDIRLAYETADQFPDWTPHLTMGYPETPAKDDPRDYPGTSWVNFDRLAFWVDDFDGPEFELKEQEEVSLAMSDVFVTDFLQHHGVKGQKWGVRRERSTSVTTSHTPGKKIKAKGGQDLPSHEDAVKAAVSKQRAKKSTTDALSNKELKDLVERMNLEQQYSRLSGKGNKGEGQKFVEEQLKSVGRQKIQDALKKTAKAAAVGAVLP
jgi:2'-5' RNA ligase